MFWVYILESIKDGGYYTGSSGDLADRLNRHFQGRSRATKSRLPLKLVYKQTFVTKKEAQAFERYIKKQKSKKYIERLIKDKMGR